MAKVLIIGVLFSLCITGAFALGWNVVAKVLTVNDGDMLNLTCEYKEVKNTMLRDRAAITKDIIVDGKPVSDNIVKNSQGRADKYIHFKYIQHKKSHLMNIVATARITDSGMFNCERRNNFILRESHKIEIIVLPIIKSYSCSLTKANKEVTLYNYDMLQMNLQKDKDIILQCIVISESMTESDAIQSVISVGHTMEKAVQIDTGFSIESTSTLMDRENKIFQIKSNITLNNIDPYWNMQNLYISSGIYNSSQLVQFKLQMQYVPIIKCQNSEVFAKVSGDVKFICVVRSNPSSDIAWLSSEGIKYGDKYSRFTIEYQVDDDDTTKITLMATGLTKSELNTKYKIEAKNEFGNSNQVLRISTKPILKRMTYNASNTMKIEVMLIVSMVTLLCFCLTRT